MRRRNPSLEVREQHMQALVRLSRATGETPSEVLARLIEAADASKAKPRAKAQRAARASAGPVPASPRMAGEFADEFDAQFTRLDERGQNQVLLRDLRAAMPAYDRASFDAGIQALRNARRVTLDASDGRHVRLPESARAAGIVEGSRIYVYAARREARDPTLTASSDQDFDRLLLIAIGDVDRLGRHAGLAPIDEVRERFREQGWSREQFDAALLRAEARYVVDLKTANDPARIAHPELAIQSPGRGHLMWVVAR